MTGQPRLGLAGLLLVVPIAVLLAYGWGGAEGSVRVLAPPVTCALSLVAMVAFWWDDWPGTVLRPSWAGWADTALIAAGAVALDAAGATLPMAAAAFVAMLQLTLVGEGWPLKGLPTKLGGVVALAASWAMALALGAVGADDGDALILVGAWQTLFFVAWSGWPFSRIRSQGRRLACAHAGVLGCGLLTYALAGHALTAAASCFIAAALLVGMLLEGWLGAGATLLAALVLGAALTVALRALAGGMPRAEEWVVHAGLNAIGVSVILHVAIGRRWPFARQEVAAAA